MKGETKEQRFKRVAERRVRRVLDSLRSYRNVPINECTIGMKNSLKKSGMLLIMHWNPVKKILKMQNLKNFNCKIG